MPSDPTQPQQPGSTTSTQDRAQLLVRQINNLVDLLRSQRDLLRQKGVNLPTGALDNLRTLKTRVDGLSKQLTNAQGELRHLRALADTTALINSTLETDAVLNQVMDTVVELTGAERGYIVLKDPETGKFDQFRVARGMDTTQLAVDPGDGSGTQRNELIVSKTIVNDVARTGESVLTDNASQDERYKGQESIVGFALRSIMAVPLKMRDEVIGVVYCDNRVLSGLFQASDRDMLTAFANQAGVAIYNAQLFDQARERLAQITEMRELLDNVFDSIANGVITVDTRNIITTCNVASNRILGLNYDAVGRPLYEVLPPLGEEFEATLRQVSDEGEQQKLELEVTLDGGRPRFWTMIIGPLRDADTGVIQGLALVLDDLTDVRQHEAQLIELRRYLPGALVDKFKGVQDVNMGGEEREISVIATDVRGFTSFAEKLEPEELMLVINKYLSLATDAINLYEGIVDRYMGDAVTGLFNTQLNPQSDHAARAVRAAMSIVYDLFALHEVLPEEQRLYYGIGIHTAPAFLGNVGNEDRQEFTALGDASLIAKILESNAKGGEIIVSEATYEHIKDLFECEVRAPEKTKGRDDIVKVYKVVGRKKGTRTTPLFYDPELADLINDLDLNED